jgi:predicted phosphoadenosine phosphosulfate sulfurtransferase
MKSKIESYIANWKKKGYSNDIPEEVPVLLNELNKAPSYKAICLAILKNDNSLKTLGYQPRKSKYYHILKKIEIEARESNGNIQLEFNFNNKTR